MNSEIFVSENITSAIAHFPRADERLAMIRQILDEIDELLEEKGWPGPTHERCKEIHAATAWYTEEVKGLVEQMFSVIVKLKKDSEGFITKSENIRSIQEV
jgi:hypothetical protein